MGHTNNWKILSDNKWVMVPNGVGCFKWWVAEIEWGVMSDKKKKKSKQGFNDPRNKVFQCTDKPPMFI